MFFNWENGVGIVMIIKKVTTIVEECTICYFGNIETDNKTKVIMPYGMARLPTKIESLRCIIWTQNNSDNITGNSKDSCM